MVTRMLILALLICASASAQQNPDWTRPFPAFKLGEEKLLAVADYVLALGAGETGDGADGTGEAGSHADGAGETDGRADDADDDRSGAGS